MINRHSCLQYVGLHSSYSVVYIILSIYVQQTLCYIVDIHLCLHLDELNYCS